MHYSLIDSPERHNTVMNTNNNEITILIIDDAGEDLRVLSDIIEQLSYTASQAYDRKSVLNMVNKKSPDIILFDTEMAGLNSFEMCRLLKQREALKETSIIFFGPFTKAEDKVKVFRSGGSDYITKPFHFDEIKIRLENQLVQLRCRQEVKRNNHISEQALTQLKEEVKEKKWIEEELKKSEERYRKLIECATDAIISFDEKGIIHIWNHSAESIFGYTKREALNQSISTVIPKQSKQDHKSGVWELSWSGTSEFNGRAAEFTGIKKDGTIIPIEISSSVQKFGNGHNLYTVIIRDITERKMIEAELLKVQKLESLGVLAGGIAHDFNNYLAGILGNIALAKIDTNKNEKVLNRLQKIEKVTLLSRKLTNQLITFSKGGAPITKTVAIKEVIEDSISLSLRGSNVICNPIIPNEIWPVEIDVGQMTQVINNLLINAYQAMPNGGEIHLRVQNVTLNKHDVPLLKAGNYIKILLEDQGVGISEDEIENIFDPFFTTKQEGSGLGLTTCYSIIKNHGGAINVESEQEVGTRFSIYLPASKIVLLKKGKQEEPLTFSSGRILLMDDEDLIREATGRILNTIGYAVELAQEGSEAIKLFKKFKEKGEPFDLVILDLTVRGGLGGISTIKELVKINPDVKVIVTSGYSKDPVMTNFRDYGFSGVIAKPYNIQELGRVLRNVKEGRSK